MRAARAPSLYVLAGPNGGGKSGIMGAMVRGCGADYYNPDQEAQRLRSLDPRLSVQQANSLAWVACRDLLERVIRERKSFAFESTLGGNTIPSLLERAAGSGLEVRIWFVALASPELHIERVQQRVARGGHGIPEQTIRERYDRSRQNLIRLLPGLTELRLFDNSDAADLEGGEAPRPRLVLHTSRGRMVDACPPEATPAWARAIVEVAARIAEGRGPRR